MHEITIYLIYTVGLLTFVQSVYTPEFLLPCQRSRHHQSCPKPWASEIVSFFPFMLTQILLEVGWYLCTDLEILLCTSIKEVHNVNNNSITILHFVFGVHFDSNICSKSWKLNCGYSILLPSLHNIQNHMYCYMWLYLAICFGCYSAIIRPKSNSVVKAHSTSFSNGIPLFALKECKISEILNERLK